MHIPNISQDGTLVFRSKRGKVDILFTRDSEMFPNTRMKTRSPHYDVTPDGKRFVMIQFMGEGSSTMTVVQNWYKEFEDQTP